MVTGIGGARPRNAWPSACGPPVEMPITTISVAEVEGLGASVGMSALDGGRAMFLMIESITRKRVNPRVEAAVHTAGFVLLLGILVIVSFKDIFGRG